MNNNSEEYISASPKPFLDSLGNVFQVEVVPNGNELPVVIFEKHGRRYLVEAYMWDVTNVPFYRKTGLFQRLARRRSAKEL